MGKKESFFLIFPIFLIKKRYVFPLEIIVRIHYPIFDVRRFIWISET